MEFAVLFCCWLSMLASNQAIREEYKAKEKLAHWPELARKKKKYAESLERLSAFFLIIGIICMIAGLCFEQF